MGGWGREGGTDGGRDGGREGGREGERGEMNIIHILIGVFIFIRCIS